MSPEAVPAGADPFDLPRLCRYFSERSPQPMVAVGGPAHVVRYLNPAFARLSGRAADQLVGRPFAEAVPEPAGNGCLGLLDRVFRTGAPETLAEQEHRRAPPGYWSYAMWAIPGADGHPVGVMVQVTDATEVATFRARAAAMNEALVVSSVRQHELTGAAESLNTRLRAAHDQLEARVRERTAELARANDALTAEIARRERAEAARHDLQHRLASAQEDERRRIARELHDQTGQHLAALGLGLKVVGDATPDPSPARDRLRQLQALTDRIGREVHDLALELRPTALDDLGLEAALGNYAERWAERAGVGVDFHAVGLDDRLPAAVESTLYRVVQEALTNVLRHARARRVSVVLQRGPGDVVAVVEDDGAGFDPEPAAAAGAAGRLGILGMRERVALVRGTLTVESTPGRGATVIARVPLPPADGGGGDG